MASPYFTVPDFGPSDLLTNNRFDVRRIKTSSEPSLGGATENGLTYAISGSFNVLMGGTIAMNFNPAAESVIHSVSVDGDYTITLYDAAATGTADGIFASANRNLLSGDVSPGEGQIYSPASANGSALDAGWRQISPFVVCGFGSPVSAFVENTSGVTTDIRITIVYEEIGERAASFGLTASTELFPDTEMSVYG